MHRAFFFMIFRRLSWLSQSYSCFVCIIYTVASFRFVSFLLFGQVNRVSQLNRLSGIKRKRWVAKHRATTVNIITKPFISTNGEFVADDHRWMPRKWTQFRNNRMKIKAQKAFSKASKRAMHAKIQTRQNKYTNERQKFRYCTFKDFIEIWKFSFNNTNNFGTHF